MAPYGPAFDAALEAERAAGRRDGHSSLLAQWEAARKTLPYEYSRWEQIAEGVLEGSMPTVAQMQAEVERQFGIERGQAFAERFPQYLPALASTDLSAALEKQREIHTHYRWRRRAPARVAALRDARAGHQEADDALAARARRQVGSLAGCGADGDRSRAPGRGGAVLASRRRHRCAQRDRQVLAVLER
jgi:hypothetical protein